MKQLVFSALLLILAVLVIPTSSCYYDNEQDLYGTDNTCDTASVSFSTDIKPIIDGNCVRCHAPGGEQEGSPLQTYDQLKNYVADNNLVDRVTGVGSLMPPEGKMSDCNLALIQAWVNAGAPNN